MKEIFLSLYTSLFNEFLVLFSSFIFFFKNLFYLLFQSNTILELYYLNFIVIGFFKNLIILQNISILVLNFLFDVYENFHLFIQFPIFFYFGVLFFLITCFGFLFISYLGLYGVFWINSIVLLFFWISLLISFNDFILYNNTLVINVGKWFYIFHNFSVNLEFFIDSLSITYILLTLTISYFVQLYAFTYFRYEPLVERLILFLNSFILSMIFFVSSANLILLFLGWELIGLTSFVLINFWVSKKSTLKAAFKAFVFNKISDIFFFIFIILAIFVFNSIDIITIMKQSYTVSNIYLSIFNYDFSVIELLSLSLMVAAFIKSAQLGFHLWLPDSMEAPVPASALIHSATLVSAGLFLLLRFNSILENSNYIIFLIVIVSSLTSCYGGLGAMFQSDVKRILAYSTISHCGFLIVSFYFFSNEITLFYLYVHGFFKAAVFLCVGNVIRFNNNIQDFRRMGGLSKYLVSDCYFISIGLFNLGGLPLSIGFYMKHNLLTILQQNTYFNSLILTICVFGALTGLFYSYKLVDYVFFDFKKAKKYIYSRYNKLILIDATNIQTINSTQAFYAIKGLFITAYILCIWFYFIYKNMFVSLDYFLFTNTNLLDLSINNTIFLWNLFFINWIILLLFISILYSMWRFSITYINVYNNYFFYIIFFILFFFILSF